MAVGCVRAVQGLCMCMLSYFSRVQLFVTLWTAARQVSLSMGFSRQEYWSGLPCPPPGDLPNPGIKPTSLMSPALAGKFYTTEPPGKPFPSPGDLPNPGIEPAFLTPLALAGRFFPTTAAWDSELLGSRRGFTHCS